MVEPTYLERSFSFSTDTARYLLDNGIIGSEDARHADFQILDVTRSNPTLKIILPGSRGLFVKSAITGRTGSVAREAKIVSDLRRPDGWDYLPTLLHANFAKSLFVYELFDRSAPTLWQQILRGGKFNRHLFKAIGRAIAHYSNATYLPYLSPRPVVLPLPFYFNAPQLSSQTAVSNATIQLLKIIRFARELIDLTHIATSVWLSQGPIHFDLRLDNIIIVRAHSSHALPKIVDWEFAAYGDPIWDLSTVVADVIGIWIASVAGLDQASETSGQPTRIHRVDAVLSIASQAVNALYQGFRLGQTRPLASDRTKIAVFVVMKLLQNCYERSLYWAKLTKDIVMTVQFCANIAKRPDDLFVLLERPR